MHGTEIRVDATACARCGACSAVCPTSAVERSFLPEVELRDLLRREVRAGRPLLVTGAHHDELVAAARDGGWQVLTLPSLLILDQTALLFALGSGPTAVAVMGCRACDHGALDLVAGALEVARRLSGRVLPIAIGDASAPEAVQSLRALADVEPHPSARPTEAVPIPAAGPRRAVLAELLAGLEPAGGDDRPLPGFGAVAVDDPSCTLCGACARACPTGALALDGGVLSTRNIDCIDCGLCAAACPEAALSLTSAPMDGLLARRHLVVDELVACVGCGGPHLPARLLRHAQAVVDGAAQPPTRAGREIDLCPSCRSVVAEAPRARTAPGPEPVGVPQVDRRGFLGGAVASVGGVLALVAAGSDLAEAAPVTEPRGRLGMVIDINRCIGCHACTAVCKAENHVPLGMNRDWVEEYTRGTYPDAVPVFVPKLCNHCSDPGCLRACPTGAIFRRSDGIIDLDHSMCIGCRACNQACPYGCTFVDPVRHTADKCNLCAHRIDDGLNPACVDICPSRCRVFGDLDDPDSAPRRLMAEQPTQVLRPELGLGPNVHYVGLPADPGAPTPATTNGETHL